MRLGVRVSSTLSYLLPDLLGSPTVALKSDGSFQAVQLFSPYGSMRYSSGSMPTDYNFTGQRLDSETGLIYDNFRYYDPLSGNFTRADTVDTNAKGMDGYGYVGDNPEGRTDPTGHCWPLCTMIIGAVIGAAVSVATTAITSAVQGKPPTAGQLLQAAAVGAVTGANTGLVGPEAGPVARVAVGAVANGVGQMVGNAISGKPLMDGVVQAAVTGAITGGIMEGVGALFEGPSSETATALEEGTTCSFTFDTRVATAHGKQAIGKLHAGEKVLAYNPKTHQMELQPILHVWINHDHDLVDLTLTTTLKTRQGHGVSRQSEVIHTNKKHPFFTEEQGFLSVGQLKLGMHVLRADGLWGIVTGWKIVPGSSTMYNLEVAQDHTFTVGADEWVVHNCNLPQIADAQAKNLASNLSVWGRRFSTVAVAFVRDEEGNTSRLVSMNSASISRWSSGIRSLIDPTEWVGASLNHAEANILQYAGDNNLEVLAIGASRNVCENCWSMITSEWGPGVIGTPSSGGWYPSWMWRQKFLSP